MRNPGKHRIYTLGMAVVIVAGCGGPAPTEQARPKAERNAVVASSTPPARQAPAAQRRTPLVSNAKQKFEAVMRLIADKYVDSDVSEDALYSGALQGVLDQLSTQRDTLKANAMLSPEQLQQIRAGLKGSFSGIGVVFRIVEQAVLVKEVLPGAPAEAAGIKAGDRIVAVDGKRLRGLDMGQIATLIRGKTGSVVKLYLQRDTEEWTREVKRGRVELPAAAGTMLPGKVAYLRLSSFNDKTLEQLDQAVSRLTGAGATAAVIDLRGSPGGKLDVALGTAERFLPPGLTIVSTRGRDGRTEVKKSSQSDPADALPLVLLVGKRTASGAEIVAAALSENERATLIGEQTMGKGSVEEVFELQDGWAVKLSVERFYSPAGNSLHGTGLTPHFRLPPRDQAQGFKLDREQLSKDAQVQAALRLLSLGRSK